MKTLLALVLCLFTFTGWTADVNETNIPIAVIGAVTTNDYIRILTNCAVSMANGKTRLLKIGDLLSLVPPSTGGGAQVWTNDTAVIFPIDYSSNSSPIAVLTDNGGITIGTNTATWWGVLAGASGETLVRESDVDAGEQDNASIWLGSHVTSTGRGGNKEDTVHAHASSTTWKTSMDNSSSNVTIRAYASRAQNDAYIRVLNESRDIMTLSPLALVSVTPYILGTENTHTSTNLLEVANNQAIKFSVDYTGMETVVAGAMYPSNSLLPTVAQIGVGGYWVGNSNGVLVTLYSIDGIATVMKVLAP